MTNTDDRTVITVIKDKDSDLEILKVFNVDKEKVEDTYFGSVSAKVGCSDGTLLLYDQGTLGKLLILKRGSKFNRTEDKGNDFSKSMLFNGKLDWVIACEDR